MAELRSKSSEDLASSKQKSRDRSSSSSSLKGSRKSPQKDTNTSSEAGEEEKGVDFDSFLSGNSCNTHEKDAEEGKLVHLTANRAKAPKRRPPSSHFTTNNTSREVSLKFLRSWSR